MKHTREEIITALHIIKDTCNENGFACDSCPFYNEEEKLCWINGDRPDHWTEIDGKTLLLVELNEPVQEGHEYHCYKIGEKIYQGIWTNSHDELVQMYRETREQLRLF